MVKVSFFCLLIFIDSMGFVFSQSPVKRGDKEVVLSIYPGSNNPRNSEGDFITLKDHRILYIYTHYTGTSSNDNAHAYLAGRYSSDNGKTWTNEDVKIIDQEGALNVMSVSLLRLQNDEIALFYLKINSETDCIPFVRFSNDEAKTWSDPQPCISNGKGYFVLNNDRVIQLNNGRIILPVAMHQSLDAPKFSIVGRVWCYFSDDNGRSWKSSREVPNPKAIVTQEPGVIQLKNGTILMFMRTSSGVQYFSFSEDKGETWSTVTPSNIKSPRSPASIARIPSTGDLLLIWNDNGANQKRTPLNMAISKDQGKTWINNKILEDNPDGAYCYTAIHFIGNEVLIAYSDWLTMGSTILRLNLESIYK